MRSISQAALQRLATNRGTEPILVVGIQWTEDGIYKLYADREIEDQPGIKPAILELGELDSVLAISLNESNDSMNLVLDDEDGEIKAIIDNNDIHKRDIIVYQWFASMPWEDKFPIFYGKINSPITWRESDRAISFSAVSQLEDREVGFSLEEGDFTGDLDDLIGKPWPECFGTSVHTKALKIDSKHSGSTAEAFGLADFTIPHRIQAILGIYNYLVQLQLFWAIAAGYLKFIGATQAAETAQQKQQQFIQQQIQYLQQRDELSATYQEQLDTEKSSIRIIGGEDFPEGQLTLNINGALLTGNFVGDIFYISSAVHPEEKNFFPDGPKQYPSAETYGVTQATGDGFVVFTGNINGDQAGPFFAQAGATVTIESNEPLRYIVSITPGTVLKVAAFTTIEGGERILLDVPTSLYNVTRQSFGSVSATIVEVTDALSKQTPQPWEDTIYVTFQSSIGPNPVEIMEYMIDRYTDFATDRTSFNSVRSKVANYPMHFVFPGRKNIFTALQELAFQARCAIFLRNGEFVLKYLPLRPDSVHTFTESNVDVLSMELGFTDTEDLVTVLNGTWRQHGAQEDTYNCNMRYNVKKYGKHVLDFDFYAYNNIQVVVKVMTYWLIRRGNTWKKLRFQASLDALNAETFDGVTLNFASNYHANSSTLGIVEAADYNSENNTIDFDVWTGVRAGEMSEYDLSYPADVSTSIRFPSAVEERKNYDGGGGVGSGAGGDFERRGPHPGITVTYNGTSDPFGMGSRKNSDKGTNKPSDRGDTSPGSPDIQDTGGFVQGIAPPPTPELTSQAITDDQTMPFYIDIRVTEVLDSQNPGNVTTFDTFFKKVTNNKLFGDVECEWSDGSNDETFDFKFDSEGGEWGAGTAFLKDD